MPESTQLIRVGHSPDPDDAFMFYALARQKIATGRYRFDHVMADIETLNRRAEAAQLEVTAISLHQFPFIAERYALLGCGCSMGDGYGPMVVARQPMTTADLAGKRIAIPGERTTAFLALNLCLGRDTFQHATVMFDKIPAAVAAGEFDAGLLIHEAQLTHAKQGLHCIVDLGVWWQQQTGLPLPLGGNVIRRDLGPAAMREVARLLRQSVQYGLDHREAAIEYAQEFGRDLDHALTDKFVGMYVNKWTLDYGDRGRTAVRELLKRGAAIGMIPDPGTIEFIDA